MHIYMYIHMSIYGQIIPFHSMCGNPGQEIGLNAATVNIYFCPQVILRPLKGNTGLEG